MGMKSVKLSLAPPPDGLDKATPHTDQAFHERPTHLISFVETGSRETK
jgi:hypothetical protein